MSNKSVLPPASEAGAAIAEAILSDVSKDSHTDMRTRQAHLFGRINPPDHLLDDESYQVDLSAALFTIIWSDRIASKLPVQLIGTYSHSDGSFLWGHYNPSIAQAGYERLAEVLLKHRNLAPLAQIPRFFIAHEVVENLMKYVTHEMDCIGPYPAAAGDATAYLAVSRPDGKSEFQHQWCTFCGGNSQKMISSELAVICNAETCLGTFQEIAESSPAVEGTAPAGFECAFCRGNTGVISHNHTGICRNCLAIAADALS